jgi:hypothetical protein
LVFLFLVKDSQNPLYLKFKLSGTTDNGFIMGDDKVYISFRLPTITTTKEAKELFDKWVQVLDKINFNGVKMLGTLCENNCGEYVVYSKVWAFDDKRKDLSPLYYPFKISLESMNIEAIWQCHFLLAIFRQRNEEQQSKSKSKKPIPVSSPRNYQAPCYQNTNASFSNFQVKH